jgi:hypothetical protein
LDPSSYPSANNELIVEQIDQQKPDSIFNSLCVVLRHAGAFSQLARVADGRA